MTVIARVPHHRHSGVGRNPVGAARRHGDGARSAPSPQSPTPHVIPANAGTYWGASVRESGNLPIPPRLALSAVRQPQRSNGAHLALKSAHSALMECSFSAHLALIRRSKALTGARRPPACRPPPRSPPGSPTSEVLRPVRPSRSAPSPSLSRYYDTTLLRSATPSAILTPIERSEPPARRTQ